MFRVGGGDTCETVHKHAREHKKLLLSRSIPRSPPKHIIRQNLVRFHFSSERAWLSYLLWQELTENTTEKVLHMVWAILSVTPELTILSFLLPQQVTNTATCQHRLSAGYEVHRV